MVQQTLSHLLATDVEFVSPLIAERELKHVGIVVFGSDDGLCGAFNINLFKHLLATINDLRQQYGSQVGVTVIPVGKKLTKAAMKIAAPDLQVERTALNTRSTGSELSELTTLLRTRFLDGSIDRAEVLYMHFKSTSRQEFMREQMLPVSYESIAQQMDARAAAEPCLFEPDANTIFNSVLPLHLRAMMQEVYTESAASEQASRVMAMQTASDNAKELLDELNLEYNKLRQQSITTELLDIIGGQVQR